MVESGWINKEDSTTLTVGDSSFPPLRNKTQASAPHPRYSTKSILCSTITSGHFKLIGNDTIEIESSFFTFESCMVCSPKLCLEVFHYHPHLVFFFHLWAAPPFPLCVAPWENTIHTQITHKIHHSLCQLWFEYTSLSISKKNSVLFSLCHRTWSWRWSLNCPCSLVIIMFTIKEQCWYFRADWILQWCAIANQAKLVSMQTSRSSRNRSKIKDASSKELANGYCSPISPSRCKSPDTALKSQSHKNQEVSELKFDAKFTIFHQDWEISSC